MQGEIADVSSSPLFTIGISASQKQFLVPSLKMILKKTRIF